MQFCGSEPYCIGRRGPKSSAHHLANSGQRAYRTPNTGSAAQPSAQITRSRYLKNKDACGVVLLELCDSDCAPAKQVFDDSERKVTLLDVHHLGWKSKPLTHCDKISVGGDDGIPVRLRPIPDAPVICLLQADVPNVCNVP